MEGRQFSHLSSKLTGEIGEKIGGRKMWLNKPLNRFPLRQYIGISAWNNTFDHNLRDQQGTEMDLERKIAIIWDQIAKYRGKTMLKGHL